MVGLLLRTALQVCFSAPAGYVFTRALVHYGVPLDTWGRNLASWAGVAQDSLLADAPFWTVFGMLWVAFWTFAVYVTRRLWPSHSPGDLSEWQRVDPLTIWQAARLWAGEKPIWPMEYDKASYPAFRLLKNAAKAGHLTLTHRSKPLSQSEVSQAEVARYAAWIGATPKFQFAGAVTLHVEKLPPVSKAPIQRDVWLYDAICYILLRRWERIGQIDNDASLLGEVKLKRLEEVVLMEIPQYAFEGRLPVWGKGPYDTLWKPIPASVWDVVRPDWYGVINGKPEALKTSESRSVPTWRELMTSRASVEAIWPANIH